jgi:hypothetical protein
MESLSTARDLALRAPQGMLPCPVCAASVRGVNLARHLESKHPDAPDTSSWSGQDRRVRRPLLGLLVVALVGVVALGAVAPGQDPVVGQAPREVVIGFLVVAFALLAAGVLSTGLVKARLSVEDDQLVLRYALGFARRRVRLGGATVESGGLERLRSTGNSSSSDYSATIEAAGTYLAVDAGRRLVVGCSTGTGLRGHWSGWRQGPKRRRWDIDLDPAAFVGVQYALHRQGLLAPRAADTPRASA